MPIDFPIMKIFPFLKKRLASVVILLIAQLFFNLLLMEIETFYKEKIKQRSVSIVSELT